jgi:hypothetical protein
MAVTSWGGVPLSTIGGAAINNALLDPLQGFDADCWVMDQATGAYVLVGRFTSIQISIRNASEPYLELNQRLPRFLDGEFQIGFVLERGLLDARVLEDTFGYNAIVREFRLSRSPRMQITFELYAPELDASGGGIPGADEANTLERAGELKIKTPASGTLSGSRGTRKARGQYRLTYAKVDTLTIGIMAGRSVIANRWEGIAEGIEFVDNAIVWPGVTMPEAAAGVTARARAVQDLESASPATPYSGIGLPNSILRRRLHDDDY